MNIINTLINKKNPNEMWNNNKKKKQKKKNLVRELPQVEPGSRGILWGSRAEGLQA